MRRTLALALGLATGATAYTGTARAEATAETAAAEGGDAKGVGDGIVDPRKRRWPNRHRFRLGFQLDYVRLSAAIDDEGVTQRFHYLPLQLDFAYQVQLFKYFMLRPSVAIGANPANTLEAMPVIVQPQIFGGFQGKAVGVALGYGWFTPFPATPNVISNTRGGLGQPVITDNHAVRGELSYTTRVDRGALAFAVRLGGLKSHIRHYELDDRSWRFFFGINIGWYFGDGHKSAARQAERQKKRRRKRR